MSFLLEEQMRIRVEELRREADGRRSLPRNPVRYRAAMLLRWLADRLDTGEAGPWEGRTAPAAFHLDGHGSLLQGRNGR